MEWNTKLEREYVHLRNEINSFADNDAPMPDIKNLSQGDKDEICENVDYIKENIIEESNGYQLDNKEIYRRAINKWYEDNIF